MSAGNYIDDCLQRKLLFLTGKGGVGKTSLAWSTALACARRGKRVTVASWNPTGSEVVPTSRDWGVDWLGLETMAAFKEYVLRTLYFEKLFDAVFDNHVFRTFVMATPGLSDTVIAGKIWDRCERQEQDLLIVDLPSTGHAISFLKSPIGVQEVFSMGVVRRETDRIRALFSSPATRFDVVATAQELPMTEAVLLNHTIEKLFPGRSGYLLLNKKLPVFATPTDTSALSAEDIAILERYRADEKEQTATLSQAPSLPRIDIEHHPSKSFQECVERITRGLEAQHG